MSDRWQKILTGLLGLIVPILLALAIEDYRDTLRIRQEFAILQTEVEAIYESYSPEQIATLSTQVKDFGELNDRLREQVILNLEANARLTGRLDEIQRCP